MEDSGPLYKERCLTRIGKSSILSIGATWPFGKFEIYCDKLIVRVLINKIILQFSEIESMEKYSNPLMALFGEGIKINHNKNTSTFVVIWPKKIEEVIKLLKQKGIKII